MAHGEGKSPGEDWVVGEGCLMEVVCRKTISSCRTDGGEGGWEAAGQDRVTRAYMRCRKVREGGQSQMAT